MSGYNEFQKISELISNTAGSVDWKSLMTTPLKPLFEEMAETEQNPDYHGEIDVFSHTKLVCEALTNLPEFERGSAREKIILFWAALLHDIGKTRCTIIEDGKIKSPSHSSVGAVMARNILWKDFGLCGSYEKQQTREAICSLVRYHSFPPYALSDGDSEYKILKIAANGELTADFTLSKLYALEKADVLGRISKDRDESSDKIEYFKILADETKCQYGPFQFANDFSKRAYFKGKTNWKEQNLFKDTWGEVILMSGLPGTGKDTWIKENCPELPMISLDEIRRKLNVSPTDSQRRVSALAHETAKEYLRKKQPFIWNATNITSHMRGMQISLFEDYGASVKTVFLETDFQEQLRRNAGREAAVPEAVIEKMRSKLEPPERFESEKVLWEIV